MPAAITYYLYAGRVKEVLQEAADSVSDEAAFLWGAQGLQILSLQPELKIGAAAVERQTSEQLQSLLRIYVQQSAGTASLSCACGFLCAAVLQKETTPFISCFAQRLQEQDPQQPAEILVNEEETALDTILLRYERGLLPTDFPLQKTLPKSDTASQQTAGLCAFLFGKLTSTAESEELCEKAAADCRRLYRRTTDPTGLRRIFYQRHEKNGLHQKSSQMRSFMEDGSFDYANLQQLPWGTAPQADSRTFLQLYEDIIPLGADLLRTFLL
ncbi:MAG: hypothetical protein LKE53_05715 [Oscillospiraceae bacterium]|nr:hypothetical protein [Oscillospiraceae bacterium]MDD3261326.1 hypothetical protein [Oscillospiraceae bacterium]